ncbi:acyl-CoA dehydrogenase [Rhodospirillum rubrum]|uniref:3-methylmercaptopropionyl-CoA dehydrogenase n=1 Tax=Rhodospirillum rubrum (strain ATCC 11170 / ATH 1.1.1 / DSM 467 / LMG 4362 / NCIMB 8255 / S1) TaxID=269796 RepID=Q2RXA5_RHORT|nr:acyl-CoA dehydrogenase [Rhodospirillum rubrum]ABC21240.1 Acyl-CoA dehydrogenase [Rhodospirillum rubrum ATCC 11170]AEO46915.1 acyl-CoA dehydrogenase [Rhodospirillum rubrum F11]MBK5952793.1 acyl-CoA dehydrogenase [Rhodospirillum rubrum]QXG80925.1 acyl-CoA dehydrogenase [Rhodospirillum rubrum]HAP99761.1 acyl-CoA dehydrogenase [Rhodospirillum rubrum]
MPSYRAPIADIMLALRATGLAEVLTLPGAEDVCEDLVEAVLSEAGKLAADVLAPLNAPGDRQGSRLENGTVRTPDGFAEAYGHFVDGGWTGVPFDPEYGGQGLPWMVGTALNEIWQAANMSFGLAPLLSAGAIELLDSHGSAEQKAQWLPKLISGEWTGTMNLTEPQAGSDLAAVRTKAVAAPDLGDGVYRIFGSKIFITYGDHDLAPNIVHMVLARISDAPPGIKGISLFIVPKTLPTAEGGLGAANDLRCVSLEDKLGIHASPTCVMAFGDQGGAVGYLVGAANHGIEYMFTMMNNARLGVGVQGVGQAERATQAAVEYARARVQGGDASVRGGPSVSIIHHPDVRRMLMTMRARTQAARLITYLTAAALDTAKRHADAALRAEAATRAALLTPIAKAWSTEAGIDVANLGIQVHGGQGYIEDAGAAQFLRDARIASIYEGTNGIQAIDLVGRKVLRDGGVAARALASELAAIAERSAATLPGLQAPLADGLADLEAALEWVLSHPDAVSAQAAATPFLTLFGLVLGGGLLVEQAVIATAEAEKAAAATTAGFFLRHLLPATAGHLATIRAGAADLVALHEDAFVAA